jgi:hypothetical protein
LNPPAVARAAGFKLGLEQIQVECGAWFCFDKTAVRVKRSVPEDLSECSQRDRLKASQESVGLRGFDQRATMTLRP